MDFNIQGDDAMQNLNLTCDFIRDHVADSPIIYERGLDIYEHGSFVLRESDQKNGVFDYEVDGNYGDYLTQIRITGDKLETSCDCPYPGVGCKHTVATLLDVLGITREWTSAQEREEQPPEPFLTPEEIKERAVSDRKHRAKSESFQVTVGDMLKGEHLLKTDMGRQYTVTMHDPETGKGHCTCPDFITNQLGICKHIEYLKNFLKKKRGYKKRLAKETFPFVDIYWDSVQNHPRLFAEGNGKAIKDIRKALEDIFDEDGRFIADDLPMLLSVLPRLDGNKRVRVRNEVLKRLDGDLRKRQLVKLAENESLTSLNLKTRLYPYQEEGVKFCVFKEAALIGDEMGLGKTLQAIAIAILKKQIFGFSKILVVTLSSIKEQWKREIEKSSSETAVIVEGNVRQRETIYAKDESCFKITNYEAVLRDVTVLSRFSPDLIILDEAQRIKNFSTKTADAVKRLPRKHALVLTGTPLENKLEDVYSIVQFLDPYMLSPLWRFAADHFMLSRDKKDKILGYRNLNHLHDRLQSLVIRRKKEEVLSDLPDEVVNNYYLDLHEKQWKIHTGYAQALAPLLSKKFLTPMDLRRIQEILLRMRMVCNSTYLIDRKTHISPKLKELENIIDEIVIQNNRKMVIFSEWTTMTFLIARHLSDAAIPFVELSGKVPVKKRQALIDEFTHNRDCKVFLSTDAGGTGLNLQAADCVVNFELPWNPARLNQRVGRVNRIGQKSRCVNVVNLISKGSIEEKILAGIQLKTDLFHGVFEGNTDMVEFSVEKRNELLNRLREMIGEEPLLPAAQAAPSEEIPEDTPYYLNPQVLKEQESQQDFTGEEAEDRFDGLPEPSTPPAAEELREESAGDGLADQPPEKIEAVLNSGMQFIGGLMEMATGRKMTGTGEDGRMVKIDRQTGEVTLKFKLPGF